MGLRFDRVVEVDAWVPQQDGSVERGYGTGYFVADRLVLAAGHTVRALGADSVADRPIIRFKLPSDGSVVVSEVHSEWLEAQVVWSRHDTDLDGALLEIIDPKWPSRPEVLGRVRWGALTTSRPQARCAGTGFPLSQTRPAPPRSAVKVVRDTEHFAGYANPGTGLVCHRYEVTVTDARREITMPAVVRTAMKLGTAWAGMSGAPVFFDDDTVTDPGRSAALLAGIVIEDPVGCAAGDRLVLQPITGLATDPEFRTLVQRHTGVPLIVESVEHLGVFEDPCQFLRPDPQHRSPGFLLRADAEVVGFRGRDSELKGLEQWCASPRRMDVRLITGDGGQGKTRLARQLTARMRDRGWVTGHLGLAIDVKQATAAVGHVQAPLLVVVDYAETRPDVVTALIAAAGEAGQSAVRILLLARSAGQWWQQARMNDPVAQQMTEYAIVDPLGPLDQQRTARGEAYSHATRCFAERLDILDHAWVEGVPGPWGRIGDRLRRDDLDDDRYETALAIHMEALADLLQAGPKPVNLPAGSSAEDVLLAHERRYWLRTANEPEHDPEGQSGVPVLGALVGEHVLQHVVSVATLGAAEDLREAVAVLVHAGELRDQPKLAERAARWARRVYPPPAGAYWGTLQPDRLGEYLVGTVVNRNALFLRETVPHMSEGQSRRALTVLSRACRRHRLQQPIDDLLWEFPNQLVPLGVKVVPQLAEPQPVADAIKLARRQLTGDAVVETGRQFIDRSIALANIAAELHGKAAESADDPTVAIEQRILQAGRLALAGNATEAVAVALRAVTDCHELRPRELAHLHLTARALMAYATALLEIHQPQQALDVCHEIVTGVLQEIYDRGGSPEEPVFRADALAIASSAMAHLGDLVGAREFSKKALELTRQLSFTDEDTGHAILAARLCVHGPHVVDTGDVSEGIGLLKESAELLENLASKKPDIYEPDLARTHDLLAKCYAKAGRDKDAITADRAAIGLYRRLAARVPRTYLIPLAMAAKHLAELFFQAGDKKQGIEAANEAIDAFDRHPAPDSGAIRDFGRTLVMTGHRILGDLGDDAREQVTLVDRGVRLLRQSVALEPDTGEDTLALALSFQAVLLATRSSRRHEAPVILDEALAIHRSFLARHPGARDDESEQTFAMFVDSATKIMEANNFFDNLVDRANTTPSSQGTFNPTPEHIRQYIKQVEDAFTEVGLRESTSVAPDHLREATSLCEQAERDFKANRPLEAAKASQHAAEILRPYATIDFLCLDQYARACNIGCDILVQNDEAEAAEHLYRHVIAIINPAHADTCPHRLGIASYRLAGLLMKRERYSDALPHARQAVDSFRMVARRQADQGKIGWHGMALLDLGVIYTMLHETQADQDDLWQARDSFQEAVFVLQQVVDGNPTWREALIHALMGLVSASIELHEIESDAEDWIDQIRHLYQDVCATDPQQYDEEFITDLAEVENEIRRVLYPPSS